MSDLANEVMEGVQLVLVGRHRPVRVCAVEHHDVQKSNGLRRYLESVSEGQFGSCSLEKNPLTKLRDQSSNQ